VPGFNLADASSTLVLVGTRLKESPVPIKKRKMCSLDIIVVIRLICSSKQKLAYVAYSLMVKHVAHNNEAVGSSPAKPR
jgi:hypothetical protein